jgi:hypothetical protein
VLTDEAPPKLVEEIKFGSGRSDRPEKIYLLELISPALIQKCNSLSGKISALSKNGQSISLPVLDGQTYAAEYGMQFYKPLLPLENNKCLAQIVDSLDSGSLKDKFIVSNRTRADLSAGTLNTNLFNKAVLYGGIGNRLSVTVSELKKDISIEPVGVVILGIDGLRQDVLYTPEEQQVNPSGTSSPYYVAPTHLKGLCDVLGGASSEFYCDLTGIENRHINLQNVTTIFPSITFAAWASIFTGKQPKETGILGNEFFARDILTSNQTITGLQMLPSGMITLDADGGAFRPLIAQGPYSWLDLTKSLPFILHHVMPAEFAGFNHNTTTDKISLSAPNGALQNGAIPLWDDINKMVNSKYLVSENPSTKCINSKSECRTVSIFNQYARNADWGARRRL